jgi:hypothetical protein
MLILVEHAAYPTKSSPISAMLGWIVKIGPHSWEWVRQLNLVATAITAATPAVTHHVQQLAQQAPPAVQHQHAAHQATEHASHALLANGQYGLKVA